MALVQKTARERDIRNVSPLSEQGAGLRDAAVHAVGMGCYARGRLEAADQCVGVDVHLPGQIVERQILLQISGQPFFQFFNIGLALASYRLGATGD